MFGATSITLSMLALSQVDAASRDLFIVFAVALSGLGMGSASPAMSTAIASSVDEHDLGIAGAFQQMVNQVGVAIGIQVMLAVQTARETSVGGVAAYSEAYMVAAFVAAIGVAARHPGPLHVAGGRGRARRGRRQWRRPRGCRVGWRRPGADRYSVSSAIRAASSAAAGSTAPDCMAISLVMSPWTLILPAMKACIPACGLPSMKMPLATS